MNGFTDIFAYFMTNHRSHRVLSLSIAQMNFDACASMPNQLAINAAKR